MPSHAAVAAVRGCLGQVQAGRSQGHGQASRLLPHFHCLPRTAHARLERARGALRIAQSLAAAVDVSEAEAVGVGGAGATFARDGTE